MAFEFLKLIKIFFIDKHSIKGDLNELIQSKLDFIFASSIYNLNFHSSKINLISFQKYIYINIDLINK